MDGEPPHEEDFSAIPVIERSQHRNWKARVSAYTEVIAKSAKTASDTDPFFRPFVSDGQLLRKWCTDANAVAQEKGIEAVLAIVQYSGESCARNRSEVIPGVVDKCLGAARAGTKKKGRELCAMFVEVENGGEGVVMDLITGIASKQPKVVAGSISSIHDIIESFGTQILGNIKPLVKCLPVIFGHADKTVRAEGSALVLALYTYLGAALLPALSDLKQVQLSELQKSFGSMDSDGKGSMTGRPSRFTREAQRSSTPTLASKEASDNAAGPPTTDVDPRSLVDPVNVLALFPQDLENRLGSSKWKDRLDVLEECNKILAQPPNTKICDSNVDSYHSLASTLGARCKGDANVNVVIEAAKLLEGLAHGIGGAFSRFRGVTLLNCLERLKERKASVVDALGRAVDAIFSTTTLADVVEDILVALKSKNPQVKEGTLRFTSRCLRTTTAAPGKDQIKPIAETLVALLGDSAEPVRSGGADCLGLLMRIVGERTLNPYTDGVSEIQMAKVKDAFANADIRYRAGGGNATLAAAASRPKSAKATPPQTNGLARAAAARLPPSTSSEIAEKPPRVHKNTPSLIDPSASVARPLSAELSQSAIDKSQGNASALPSRTTIPARKSHEVRTVTAPKSSAKSSSGKTLAVSPSEPVKYRFSPEEAASKAAESISPEYHLKLADAAWKTRLEAAENMLRWVEEDGIAEKVDGEILLRFLGKTPGWSEKNFQVSAKVYQIITAFATRAPTLSKAAAALAIGPLSDKLGDMKLKKPAGDALCVLAEKTSLAFILAQAYEPMQRQKAPKAQADALVWVKQQLIDFGISGVPLRDLIAFVKTGLQSPNAAVRSSATQVLVTIKIFVGADISGFLEDLNPTLLSTINSEFDKVAGQQPPEPSKTSLDLQDAPSVDKGKAKGVIDPLEDLIPRVDLDKLVAQTSIIKDAKSDSWKTRKEAFEALDALLDVKSNSRLKPTMGEIGAVLKKGMNDTNLSVKMLALGIVSKIASGMSTAFDRHTKLLVGPVASVCADQKTSTRSAGLSTLTAVAEACGSLETLCLGLGSSLETANPALRAAVLGWLAARLQSDPPAKCNMDPLAAPIVSCLEDRNGEVRRAATAILPFLIQHAGLDFVMEQTSHLKPASKATIVPLITNAKPAGTEGRPPSALSKPPSAVSAKNKLALPSRPAPGSPAASAPPRTVGQPGKSLAMKALVSSSRRALQADNPPLASSQSRPSTSRPVSAASYTPSSVLHTTRACPFLSSAPEPRLARLKKDAGRWNLDGSARRESTSYLAAQMEPATTPEVFELLFSKDHRAEEDFLAGLSILINLYDATEAKNLDLGQDQLRDFQLANVDLVLKYSALRLVGNNTQIANRCLEVVTRTINVMQTLGERFSDGEAKLFVPALVYKLGDAKFAAKLAPIFESLDKVMAASLVVQTLVQSGLDDKSAGKSVKNESLALIEKAYRKRGAILRTKDDRGFLEMLARCISDSGTRNAALSVMALMQLQGGSAYLDSVVESMPVASRDMLANRRATMTTAKTGSSSGATRMSTEIVGEVHGTPGRLQRPMASLPSPTVKRLPVASPSSRQQAATSSPSVSRAGPTSSRPVAARTAKPVDMFAPQTHRSLPLQATPKALRPHSEYADPISSIINDVRHVDPARAVDALKELQELLNKAPERLFDSAQTVADALLDALGRAFSPPENLLNMSYFRLVKHIIQSFNFFSSNQDLMRRLDYDDIYAMLTSLSLHLVQADRMGGTVQELVQFINMILISTLATPDRLLVFKAMFRLLLNLSKTLVEQNIKAENEMASHADLVIKCLWKRCKVLEEDLKTGRLTPGPLLGVLEEFVQGISPSQWRKRAAKGVALGDMPLRTVKTVMQKVAVYATENKIDIYEVLIGQFGDAASDAIVYSYMFRLVGPQETDRATRPLSPLLPLSNHPPSPSSAMQSPLPVDAATVESPRADSEVVGLVRNLLVGNQNEQIDKLYAFARDHPDQEEEIQATLSSTLGGAVSTYIRRALEQRKTAENPSPSRLDSPRSPIKSPLRPQSQPPLPKAAPRRSMGPRPSSVAVDKTAPIDAQLAQYKNVFTRSSGYLSESQSPESRNGHTHQGDLPKRGEGEPLSEIMGVQEKLGSMAISGPRASDVD